MYEEILNKEKRDKAQKEYSKQIYKKTMYYQQKYGFELNTDSNHPTWNVEADAFKHAFLSADIALKEGNLSSWLKGVYHENQTPNNPKGEFNMDSWNNNEGRRIADELKKEYGNKLKNLSQKQVDDLIAKKIMQRMKNGDLITKPTDKRKYTGFAANIDKNAENENPPQGKIFTAEEIGNMNSEEFIKNEKAINKQLETFGVPKESEAQKAVQDGSMIWVDSYTRDDGTKVNGYYRSK